MLRNKQFLCQIERDISPTSLLRYKLHEWRFDHPITAANAQFQYDKIAVGLLPDESLQLL